MVVAAVLSLHGLARAQEPPAAEPEPAPAERPWTVGVYQRTQASVVRVESLGTYAGFVVGSPVRVATVAEAVRRDRPIRVRFASGVSQAARVVAAGKGLAILEVDSPVIGAAPLALRGNVEVGMPVLAVGYSYDEADPAWRRRGRLRQAIVTASTAEWIVADAPLAESLAGAPVLAPDGRVVGVAARPGPRAPGGLVIPAAALAEVAQHVGEPVRRSWPIAIERQVALSVLPNRDWFGVGLGAGWSLIIDDRYGAAVRASGSLVDLDAREDTDRPMNEVSLHHFRAVIGAELIARLLVGARNPRYLTASFGAALFEERTTTQTATSEPVDPACDPAVDTCAMDVVIHRDAVEQVGVFPYLRLAYRNGPLDYSVAFYIDPESQATDSAVFEMGFVF